MVSLSLGSPLTVIDNTITPTHDVHRVSGEYPAVIKTINIPNPSFCGMLILIVDGWLAFEAGGNVIPSSAHDQQPTILIYDTVIEKWCPSA